MITEWRCTRNTMYSSETCLGHNDLTVRQGHYIRADTKVEALMEMIKRFPQDVMYQTAMQAFTIDCWKEVAA